MPTNSNIQRVGLEFSAEGVADLKKQLSEVTSEINKNRAEFKLVQAQWDENTKASDKLAAKQEYLQNVYLEQEKRVQIYRKELETLSSAEGNNTKAIEKKQTQLVNAESSLIKYGKELEDTNTKVNLGTANLEEFGKKLDKISDKTTKVGEGLTKNVTAPILAIGVAAIAAWKETDDAYDNIISKTGATGDVADSLADSFDAIYGNFPFDSEAVSEAIGEVNTQFDLAGKELEDVSILLLKYANINNTDVTSATTQAMQAIQAYGLSATELPTILDAITKTSQNTGVAVDVLTTKAIDGAPQIKALGLSFADGVALLGNFEQAGVDSSAALSSLSKATIVYAADNKTLSEGLADTQKKILGAKTETEALNIAAEVFGSKGAVRMVDAIKRGTLNLEELASQAQDTSGTVEDTFSAQQDPLDEAIVAWNNLKLSLSELGNIIQTMLGPILKSLSEKLKELTEWFKGLNPEQQKAVVIFGLIIAAIGPVIMIIGSLIGAIGSISAALAFLAANPIILIIAAIVAVIAIFVLFGDQIKQIMNNVFSKITEIFDKIKSFFEGSVFLGIFAGVIQNFQNIGASAKKIFEGIIDLVSGVFTGNWSKAWEGIKKIFGGVFDGLYSIAVAPLNLIIGALNGVISGVNIVIKGINKIKIPDWDIFGSLAGKGLNLNTIGSISYLAKGGELLDGMSVVAEAGPELLMQQGSKTKVVPLSNGGGAVKSELIDYTKLYNLYLKALNSCQIKLDKDGFIHFINERLLEVL